MKKLFDYIKPHIDDPKGVISDHEICVLNRRDFIYSETSATKQFLLMYGSSNATYEMHAIVDYLFCCASGIRRRSKQRLAGVKIVQGSKSMTLASLALSIYLGDSMPLKIECPRGVEKLRAKDGFALNLLETFYSQISNDINNQYLINENDWITIILCNSTNEAELTASLKEFESAGNGFILIKGYGRSEAPNCGELVSSANLHIHCTLAGFGVINNF